MSERPPIVEPPPPATPPPPPPPQERSGCATAFMLVAGIILLVPGALCAVVLSTSNFRGDDPFTAGSFALGAGGVVLILYALLRKRI